MTDLNKEREAFEGKFPKPHWIEWDEELGQYTSKHVSDVGYQARFEVWLEAKAQAVPEGYVVVPKGVLDLTRFMCKTWAEIDNFVYKNCTNLGEYPVIQGTSNQFNLAKIGNQKVDNKAIHSAVKWFLESESGAEG